MEEGYEATLAQDDDSEVEEGMSEEGEAELEHQL